MIFMIFSNFPFFYIPLSARFLSRIRPGAPHVSTSERLVEWDMVAKHTQTLKYLKLKERAYKSDCHSVITETGRQQGSKRDNAIENE